MKKHNYSINAKFFRGLSDSTRLSVLLTLLDGEMTVGEIVENIQESQSNVSNHLKCLSDCGLVKNRRDGKNVYYSLRDPKTKRLLTLSEQIISKVHADIEACLRYKE